MTLFAFTDDHLRDLAAEHGTPLFVYSAAVVERSYRTLRDALPAGVTIAYAVKANPHQKLLAFLCELGASFDCASIGELERVAQLGIGGDRIFFAGPGKRTAEIEFALQLGATIQAEGIEDLQRIDALSSSVVGCNLRIHPAGGVSEQNRIIGGSGPSAFGIDEEDVDATLKIVASLSNVAIRGIHVFAASNQRSAESLLATHQMVLELATRCKNDHHLELEMVDVGGGLGVPYREEDAPLDVTRLGRGMVELLDRYSSTTPRIVVEPGRFLAAPCGVYLARVVRVKQSRGTRFVILEGGVNHLIRPALIGEPFPTRAVDASGSASPATLAGPLCTSLDRLGDVPLPPVAPDDLIAFGTCGAYGFTEGMTHFLSHPVPPEIWVDGPS